MAEPVINKENKLREDLRKVKTLMDGGDPDLLEFIRGRDDHRIHLRSKRSTDISEMGEDEFKDFFGKEHMWAGLIDFAGVDTIIRHNSFERTRDHFASIYRFVEDNEVINIDSWERLSDLDKFGNAWLTEILALLNDNYVILNSSSVWTAKRYGFVLKSNNAEKYIGLCSTFKRISDIMGEMGFKDHTPYDADGVLKYIQELENPKNGRSSRSKTANKNTEFEKTDSVHSFAR